MPADARRQHFSRMAFSAFFHSDRKDLLSCQGGKISFGRGTDSHLPPSIHESIRFVTKGPGPPPLLRFCRGCMPMLAQIFFLFLCWRLGI